MLILADGKTSRVDDPVPEVSARASLRESQASAEVLGLASQRRLDLADNQLDTYSLLELAQRVGSIVEEIGPEVVYTHHAGDLNVDHELAARASMIACRPHFSSVQWLFAFSTLSATDAGFAGRPPSCHRCM